MAVAAGGGPSWAGAGRTRPSEQERGISLAARALQVWSEVNQAVLDYENRESTPKLAKLLKLLLWAQNELDQKKVKYPKMTDLSKGVIEEPK